MKICLRCNQTKPFSDFRVNKRNKSGYASYCTPCSNEYSKQWHEKKYSRKFVKDKVIGNTRCCSMCKNYKNFSDFKNEKYSWCNSCQKEYDRKRNEKYLARPRKRVDGLIHCRTCDTYLPESEYDKTYTNCTNCKKLNQHKKTLKKHNLTYDQYLKMYEDQNHGCKICGRDESTFRTRLSVDHDHACCPGEGSCGKCVRGLLCHHCNAALGNVQDNIQTLQKMIAYLQQSPPQH